MWIPRTIKGLRITVAFGFAKVSVFRHYIYIKIYEVIEVVQITYCT